MSLTTGTRALALRWPVLALMPIWLWLALAGSVRAQTSKVVVWLDGGEGGQGHARERALRLELAARGMALLRVDGAAGGTPGPATASDREALARQTLVRTDAEAVLWLEGDASRPVSWLRTTQPGSDAIEQAPLPHPPDAIEPELFAVAAASLLQQVLREPSAEAGPGVEPPVQPSVEPAKVAAAAAAPAEAPARSPPPARLPSDPAERPAAVRHPEPAPLWFVQAGVVLSLGHLTSGMEAATRPSRDEIFSDGPGVFNSRFFFDDRSAWVPDGDSFDDFENPEFDIPRGTTPAPGNCEADGIATGPLDLRNPSGEPFEQELPSRYCVRIEQPGFAFMPALRLLLGGWVLPRLALGFLYQGYFGIDTNDLFGSQLFGVHAEYLALGAQGRGVTLSLLAQLTAGRTETPVPPKDPERPTPNALSGPLGGLVGALVRVWPVSDFALFVAPAGGFRFPAGQLVIDLSAGAELPF
jgi:hypothetical protein